MSRRRRRQADPEPKVPADPLEMFTASGTPTTLRDIWKGSSGFLVCGGPSLKSLDVSKLAQRGIVSLGVNNVAGMAPVRAFVASDPPSKFHHGIWLDPAMLKLVPFPKLRQGIRVKEGDTFRPLQMRVRDCPGVFGFTRIQQFEPDKFFLTPGATWGNDQKAVNAGFHPKMVFTFFLGLRLLHYLGVRRVFMLGVDFHMPSQGSQYAFEQGKHAGGCQSNLGSYAKATEWLRQLVPVFERHDFELFNCNPDSALRLFPHVPFDDALAECKGPIPPEPFDLRNWYDK